MLKRFFISMAITFTLTSVEAQLSGTYTIGKSGSENYSSFKAALIDCYLKGIVNTVTFKVSPGVYEEQVIVPYIFGAKVSTPVIFESADGDSTSVVLKYKPSADSANFTLLIDATDYIIFRKMTFATDTITGRLVEITTYCTGIQFYNCRFLGWKNGAELVYSTAYVSGYNNTYTIFMNNEFINGSYAIRMTGNETTPDVYTYIQKNIFKGQSHGSIYLKNHFEPVITANYIHNYGNVNNYSAINLEQCSSKGKITENKIIISHNQANAYGIRLFKSSGMYQNEMLIANNFISSVTDAFTSAISIYNSSDIILAHNSTHLTGSTQGSINLNLFSPRFLVIASNIFSNMASGACLDITNGKNLSIDYNAYYSNSSVYFTYDGIEYPGVKAWSDSVGFDNQSLQVNPQFCSDTLLFTFNPLLDGKGTFFSEVTKDIELQTRKNPPDIGADEFDVLNFDIVDTIRVCANQRIEIDAGSGWDSYQWQDTFQQQRFVFQPSENVTKDLTLQIKVTKKGCLFYDTVRIIQLEYPQVFLGNDTTFCYQRFTELLLHAPSGFNQYTWQDNSHDSVYTVTRPADSGLKIYWVRVTNQYGCENSDSIRIYFYDCSAVAEDNRECKILYLRQEKKIIFQGDLNAGSSEKWLSIYNMQGKLIVLQRLTPELNLSALPAGNYLLHVTSCTRGYSFLITLDY